MIYEESLPPMPLSKYIDRYFLLGVDKKSNDTSKSHLIIPDGTYGLLFVQNKFIKRYELHSNECSQILNTSYFFGQKSKSVYYALDANSILSFGIKIKPAGLRLLTKVSGREILDMVYTVDEILDNQFKTVAEKLFSSKSFLDKTRICNSYFLRKISSYKSGRNSLLDNILNYIQLHHGQIDLQTLSQQFGMSYKSIERLFDREVGMSPKSYLRIIRFNSSLHQMNINRFKNLTDLGYASGYYDQNHFIKEVKYFTNLTPKEFYTSKKSKLENMHLNAVTERIKLLNC